MKIPILLCISLLSVAQATGHNITESALLEIPVDHDRPELYLNSQALALQSEQVLKYCVTKHKLDEKWNISKEEAISKLADRTTARWEQNTLFIKLSVAGDDEKEADLLLEAIAQSYFDQNMATTFSRKAKKLELLDAELEKQGDVSQEARKALTVLIQQYGIPYFNNDDETSVGTTVVTGYHQALDTLRSLELEQIQLQAKTNTLLNIPADELRPFAKSDCV